MTGVLTFALISILLVILAYVFERKLKAQIVLTSGSDVLIEEKLPLEGDELKRRPRESSLTRAVKVRELWRLGTGSRDGDLQITFEDDEFLQVMAFWSRPGLDTTMLAVRGLRFLQGISKSENELVKQLCDRQAFSDVSREFVLAHIDHHEGGARHNQRAWPSIYGTFSFCIWLHWATASMPDETVGREAFIRLIGPEETDRLENFVKACQVGGGAKEKGYFGEYPGGSPGTITTDAGLVILDSLETAPDDLEGVLSTLSNCWKGVGFAQMLSQPVYFRANRYGFRQVATLGRWATGRGAPRRLKNKYQQLKSRILADKSKFFDNLKRSKRSDGGYGDPMHEQSESNIVCTRDVLAILLDTDAPGTSLLSELREDLDLAEYLDPKQTLGFVRTRIRDRALGFSRNTSNVYGLRDASEILFLLARAAPQLKNEIVDLVDDVREMILEHYDEPSGAFVGYKL